MNVSVSEINSFLRCRRQWDISSTSRQSLRHKTTPKVYFLVGSAVHAAIEAQAKGDDPFQALEDFIVDEAQNRIDAYTEVVGSGPSSIEWQDFEEAADLARALVRQYFETFGQENPLADQGLKMVAAEVSFKIPLRDGLDFVGTFDGVAVDLETESKVWLVENKTVAQRPNTDVLRFSNQMVGYCWAFQVLTGIPVEGVLYNGIVKKPIEEPKVLKSGHLSVAKAAPVTVQSFLNAMAKNRINIEDMRYREYLTELEAQGTSKFFVREKFYFSQTQVESWGKNMRTIVEDMQGDPVIYPNFRREGCTDCFVRDLCEAQEVGDDVDSIKGQRYKVGSYGTMETVDRVVPHVVSSVDELMETLRRAEGT